MWISYLSHLLPVALWRWPWVYKVMGKYWRSCWYIWCVRSFKLRKYLSVAVGIVQVLTEKLNYPLIIFGFGLVAGGMRKFILSLSSGFLVGGSLLKLFFQGRRRVDIWKFLLFSRALSVFSLASPFYFLCYSKTCTYANVGPCSCSWLVQLSECNKLFSKPKCT